MSGEPIDIDISGECEAVIRHATALSASMPDPREARAHILCVAYALAARGAGIDDADAIETLEETQAVLGPVDLDSEIGAH